MPQDIKTGSIYNTKIPALSDTADIVVALTNYHYGVTNGVAPEDASVTAGIGIAGLFKSKAPLASPTFTGTVVLPSTTSIGSVSNTELGYLDGVTSSIQTQLNAIKTNPAFSGIIFKEQPEHTYQSTSTTLTWAQIKTLIIISYPLSTIYLNLPQASDNSSIATNGYSFDWSIINKHPTNTITIAANPTAGATHTYEGKTTISANTSARFTTKRVSATSYQTYRIS